MIEVIQTVWKERHPSTPFDYDLEGERNIVREVLPFAPDTLHIGENAHRNGRGADATVTDWMNSDSHRALILTDDFDWIGIGYDPQTCGWSMIVSKSCNKEGLHQEPFFTGKNIIHG